MAESSLFYYGAEIAKASVRELILVLEGASDAVTITSLFTRPRANAVLLSYQGDFVSQDEIDDFLGTSSEFTASQFDGTALPVASDVGVIINMEGQAADVYAVQTVVGNLSNASMDPPPGTLTWQPQLGEAVTTLPAAAVTGAQVQVGSQGNIALVFQGGAPMLATGSRCVIRVLWSPK